MSRKSYFYRDCAGTEATRFEVGEHVRYRRLDGIAWDLAVVVAVRYHCADIRLLGERDTMNVPICLLRRDEGE